MGQRIMNIEPYVERALVAQWVFWSAATSENKNIAAGWQNVVVYATDLTGELKGYVPEKLAPYVVSRNAMYQAFAEWLMVSHLNRPGGPVQHPDGYYSRSAEVASIMCDLVSEWGQSPLEDLRAAAVEQLQDAMEGSTT